MRRVMMDMRNIAMIAGVLAVNAGACDKNTAAKSEVETAKPAAAPADPNSAPAQAAVTTKKLFLDVHDVGPGKVLAKAVAEAHKKDLAHEDKYGVDFKAYWLDEKGGKIYCLAEAPSAEAINTVHKEAHGLLASKVMEVNSDNANWAPTPGTKLYLDVHHLGAGKVTAKDAAEAHKKDLAVQAKYKVKYLNYWLDADSGTIMCLSEAPNSDAAIAVHREAHGLVPDSIEEVSEGR